jgi:hypothetical protein
VASKSPNRVAVAKERGRRPSPVTRPRESRGNSKELGVSKRIFAGSVPGKNGSREVTWLPIEKGIGPELAPAGDTL